MKGNGLFILSMLPGVLFVIGLTWNDIVWLRGIAIYACLVGLFFAWLLLNLNDVSTREDDG